MKALKMDSFLSGGRSLTIGGPTNLLPDVPQNIAYNKSIPIIVGTTKDDGVYVTTGLVAIISYMYHHITKHF